MTESNKVAVVTGANRGMGLETCRQLLRRGYVVILTARDAANARRAAAGLTALGGVVHPYPLDVTDRDQSLELAGIVDRKFGRVDVLVNNAGAFFEPTDQAAAKTTSILSATSDALRQSFDTNALGALYVAQAFALLMLSRGSGRIVNVSSGMGALSTMQPGWPAYRISKAALNAITLLLAAELRGSGIKVNSVCPGWVRTDMGGPSAASSIEEGVDTTIWLATCGEDGPHGGFFRNRHSIGW